MSDESIITERRQFLWNIERQLRLREADLTLEADGYQYSYVIDFSALYLYLYKSFAEGSVSTISSESRERAFARSQVALRLVFSGEGRYMILIPPYATELRNHIEVVSLQVALANLDIRSEHRDKLARLIEHSPEFRRFINAASTDDATLNNAALDVGREYFPELYAVLTCATTKGLSILKELLNTKVLRDADDELPAMADFSYARLDSQVDRWYKEIVKLRHGKRAYQSFIDAMACTYVEVANERLNKTKRVVTFVSSSAHVRAVMAERRIVTVPSGQRFSPLRDLDYFVLAFTHGDLSRVSETLRTIGELLNLYGATAARHDSDAAHMGRKLMLESGPLWHRAENLLFLSDSALMNELGQTDYQQTIAASFLSLLQRMHAAVDEASEVLAQQGHDMFRELREGIMELETLIPTHRTAGILSGLRVKDLRTSILVTFPPLHDELPITIEFFDRALSLLADRLKNVAKHYSARALVSLRNEIMKLTREPDPNPEYCICAAYILAMEGRFDAALKMIATGLDKENAPASKELWYLEAVIHRKLFNAQRARECANAALRHDETDPRFHLEYARTLWLDGQFETDVGFVPTEPPALQLAIKHATIASEYAQRRSFGINIDAQIENMLAFLHCEQAILHGQQRCCSELEIAEQHFQQLCKLMNSKKWIGRFYDTHAWLLYATAILARGTDIAGKKGLLSAARQAVEIAIDREQTTELRKRLLLLHKNRIEGAIGAADLAM